MGRREHQGWGEVRGGEVKGGVGRGGRGEKGRGEGLEGQNKGMPYNKHVHLQDECLSID